MKQSQFNAAVISLCAELFEEANDLSLQHLRIFLALPEKGQESYSSLSKRLKMSPPVISRAGTIFSGFDTKRLKPLHIVDVVDDVNDRRHKLISLNDAGRALRRRLYEKAMQSAGIPLEETSDGTIQTR